MADLLDDYSRPFDPQIGLAQLSRGALARLGREYLLAGHLIDRVGLPLVMAKFDRDAQTQFSIDEWMGASPVYSKRMQRALGFEGDDVETVFKNLQLDIGAPPQFMDFQFRLDSPTYGEFWLSHCGALMDVEPWGPEQVRTMCHDIEDPTFDATAAATNPFMKVRPIHRPPRDPAARFPHCHWKVFVDDEGVEYDQHDNMATVAQSLVATVPLDLPSGDAEPGGWADYSVPFDPGFQLEDLSHRAQIVVAQEAAVQAHLLVRAYMLCIAQRFGDELALELGTGQWTGAAGIAAERIAKALRIDGGGIESVAKVLAVHPHFHPRSYVDLSVRLTGDASARVEIGACPALVEPDPYSWFATLDASTVPPALATIVGIVEPQARCAVADRAPDGGFAWDVVVDPDVEPWQEPMELSLARISNGAAFEFIQRRPLRR